MTLSTTWFTEGTIDFESQKYRLLAYLKEVNTCFGEAKLYPQLSDVIFHYRNLLSFRSNKRFLEEQFPKRIDEVNIRQAEILYEKILADDELMNELESITGYAEKKLKHTIEAGTEIYELVARQLTIEPVGLLSAYKNDGYFLLRWGAYHEVRAYSYTTTLFEEKDAKYRGLRIHYLQAYPHSLSHTYAHIKTEIVRQHSALHNPAFYCLETPLKFPLDETILPVAKRAFMRYLAMA